MHGNEGSKCSFAGMVVLSSLPPEEVMQIWLSLGRLQGRLLGRKMVLQKGNQDSGAYAVHACLQEPGLLLSQSFFIP